MLIAALAVGSIMLGITTGITWSVVRDAMRRRRDVLAHQDETAHVSDKTCSSCGGWATELRYDPPSGLWLCKDRPTCRSILIARSMLESMP